MKSWAGPGNEARMNVDIRVYDHADGVWCSCRRDDQGGRDAAGMG